MRLIERLLVVGWILAATVAPAGAQSFEAVGTRAAGMGGAFVAVADDASAAYWNPAGFAAGSFFSLVLDRNSAETEPSAGPAANQSGLLLALGIPALGLSYYGLRTTSVAPAVRDPAANGLLEADTLVTHHVGLTLVQSVFQGLAVGATLKLVRGYASSVFGPATARDSLLDSDHSGPSIGETHADADLGVMATIGKLKAGVTLRNASEPSFDTPDRKELRLERQARAGLSVTPAAGWILAADSDILETDGPYGPFRRFAAGTEGRVHRRATVRGGFNLNTTGPHAHSFTAGGSFAATAAVFLDFQVTGGSDHDQQGWGVAARFAY
jgi:F plasmid transfer operon, TraF, protein